MDEEKKNIDIAKLDRDIDHLYAQTLSQGLFLQHFLTCYYLYHPDELESFEKMVTGAISGTRESAEIGEDRQTQATIDALESNLSLFKDYFEEIREVVQERIRKKKHSCILETGKI